MELQLKQKLLGRCKRESCERKISTVLTKPNEMVSEPPSLKVPGSRLPAAQTMAWPFIHNPPPVLLTLHDTRRKTANIACYSSAPNSGPRLCEADVLSRAWPHGIVFQGKRSQPGFSAALNHRRRQGGSRFDFHGQHHQRENS